MQIIPIKAGTTDVSVILRFLDSADGTPELGVSAATSGLTIEYRRELGSETAITPSNGTAVNAAHSDGAFIHIGDGYYRLDIPDAACASSSGVRGVLIHAVATSMVAVAAYIVLTGYDPYDSVRAGLTALPNAAADAAGGLPISDAGGLDMDAILADTADMQPKLGTITDLGGGATIGANLVDIEAQTDDIGAAGAGLTAITGLVSGLSAAIAAVNAKTTNLPADPADASDVAASIAALNDLSAAEVNAEVVDALATDTYAEPTGVPGATVALSTKLGYLYMALRNAVTVTATKKQFLDDGGAAEWEKDLSDDGTTYTESEGNAP
jgi:hypothetical protein